MRACTKFVFLFCSFSTLHACTQCGSADDTSQPLSTAPDDCAKIPSDAKEFAPGLFYKVLKEGKVDYHPRDIDTYYAHIGIWSGTGELILSRTADLPVDPQAPQGPISVAARLARTMKKGEKRRLWGTTDSLNKVSPGLPADWPAGSLCAELEILDINRDLSTESRPVLPAYLLMPPTDAEKVENVFFVRLKQGQGARKPAMKDTVELLVSAWYLGGQQAHTPYVVDSSMEHPVEHLPQGVALMVQEMVEGDAVRLWIPAGLGVPTSRGPRHVPMVAEVKLQRIH